MPKKHVKKFNLWSEWKVKVPLKTCKKILVSEKEVKMNKNTSKNFSFMSEYEVEIPKEIFANEVKHRDVRPDQKGKWTYRPAQWAIDLGAAEPLPEKKQFLLIRWFKKLLKK